MLTVALLRLAAGLHVATHEALLIVAAGIAVSSADDVAADLVYFVRRLWRASVVYRHHDRWHLDDLPGGDLGWMAVIVPAWDEAAVSAQCCAT